MSFASPIFWRRTRAAVLACAGVAALATPLRAANSTGVDFSALRVDGASATAPAGWTLTANAAGTDVRARSADGAAGAEWGLSAVANPIHRSGDDEDTRDNARMLLIQSLRAIGDSADPIDTCAPRAYANYFTGCPFETATHRGIVFYHQYQWDENQSVVSYYIAWTEKSRWDAAGFVAANVALSIRETAPQASLNPFWAEGKQAEAEADLRLADDAYNREAHVVRAPSKTADMVCRLSLTAPCKMTHVERAGTQVALRGE